MFVVAVVVVFCSFALWLFRLLLYLFYYHFLCVRAQSTHHLPVPLWVAAAAASRWCCCCCFSYKNQLYFLVTVSAARCGASRLAAHPVHTPKATWLLDLIAIRAKYTHSHTDMDICIHSHAYKCRCNSHISFHSFLSDIPHLSSPFALFPFPYPFPFHSIIIYCGSKKCWLHIPEKKTEMNQTKLKQRQQQKQSSTAQNARACVCLLLLYFYFFYFCVRWTNFLLLAAALSLFLLLLPPLQNVFNHIILLLFVVAYVC